MQILFLAILICSSFIFPSSSFASHIELKPCVEIAHCVREEWEVSNIVKPFAEIKTFIETFKNKGKKKRPALILKTSSRLTFCEIAPLKLDDFLIILNIWFVNSVMI